MKKVAWMNFEKELKERSGRAEEIMEKYLPK